MTNWFPVVDKQNVVQGAMNENDYDADHSVKDAGGIKAFNDQKYVSKDGGTISGDIVVKPTDSESLKLTGFDHGSTLISGDENNNEYLKMNMEILNQKITLTGSVKTGTDVLLSGVAEPETGNDAANKTYVDEQIKAVKDAMNSISNVAVVETKPDNPTKNTMYYVGTANPYEVWLYTDQWYDMGTTGLDMSEYIKKTEAQTLLDEKQNKLTAGNYMSVSNNTVAFTKKLYKHTIGFMQKGYTMCCAYIFNNSATAFNRDTLYNWLKTNGHTSISSSYPDISGVVEVYLFTVSGTTHVDSRVATGLYVDTSSNKYMIKAGCDGYFAEQSKITIKDTVTQLL